MTFGPSDIIESFLCSSEYRSRYVCNLVGYFVCCPLNIISTVKPLLTTTFLHRTILKVRAEKSIGKQGIEASFSVDTSLQWTMSLLPRLSVEGRFNCICIAIAIANKILKYHLLSLLQCLALAQYIPCTTTLNTPFEYSSYLIVNYKLINH